MPQTPIVRWSGAGIVVVLVLWLVTGGGRREFERQTRETALVDIQADEVFVSYPAATFPVREAGQLALVQQFTQADEVRGVVLTT